jgi:hypothetical protein
MSAHSISEGAVSSSEGEGERVRKIRRLQKWDYSRVDKVEPTEVLQHAIAETQIVARLAAKQTVLRGLQSTSYLLWRGLTDLPCGIPILPGWGEGRWSRRSR